MPDAADQASNLAQNRWFERLARAGQVVSGVLHLLVGYIAVRLAMGSGGSADQSGAFQELAGKPGGAVALWAATVALLALAVWRVVEAFLGKASESDAGDSFDRLKAMSLALVYFAFAWSAFRYAEGAGKSSSQQNSSTTARMLQNNFGKFVLIVAALVLIGVGVYHVYKGVSKNFLDDLELHPGALAEWLGIIGYAAKGLALVAVGLMVIGAVVTSDPGKGGGLDAAVKTLGQQAFGPLLLVVTGAGIAAYGLYAFVLARYARM